MLKHKNIVPLILSLGFVAVVLATMQIISWDWMFLILILWIGFTAWGVFDIRQGYFIDVFFKKARNDSRSLALTFDDGPTPITADFLDLLKEYDAQATFFCIGKQIEKYPIIFQRILNEGHRVGNHTMQHSKAFGFLNADQVVQEISDFDKELYNHVPLQTKLFRPPFGITNPAVARAVKQTRHQVIGWNNRSLDTVLDDEDKIFQRVRNKLKPGDIVLFHDTSLKSLRALEKILKYMKENDLQSVTVDELLNLQAYES